MSNTTKLDIKRIDQNREQAERIVKNLPVSKDQKCLVTALSDLKALSDLIDYLGEKSVERKYNNLKSQN